MEKMDPSLKEQWLAALRSGRYVQVNGTLYKNSEDDKHHMCCLGVLEHVCGTNNFQEFIDNHKDISFPRDLNDPKSPEMFWHEEGIAGKLAQMNDGMPPKGIKKHSFEEIADYIEENL